MAHGALTPIIGLRLLALAAGLRHNAEIGQPGLCFSAYGHKFGINHLAQEPRPRSMILRWDPRSDERASPPMESKSGSRASAAIALARRTHPLDATAWRRGAPARSRLSERLE